MRAEDTPKEAPQLPETGRKFEDFVLENWEILDSVELDFNEDGIPDYLGVLEADLIDMGEYGMYRDCPRILFAIASDGTDAEGINTECNDGSLLLVLV